MNEILEETTQKITQKKRGQHGQRRSFPANPLKKVLEIIEAMEKNFAGDRTDPVDIADSMGTTLNSGAFRELLTSSHRYGLTNGSYKAEKIEMTSLGKSIVEYTSDEGKNNGLLRALFTPETFKGFLEKYDRKQFPRETILKNVLKNEFNIPHDQVELCASVLTQNIQDFNLVHDRTQILRLSTLSEAVLSPETTSELEDVEQIDTFDVADQEQPPSQEKEKLIPKVFISHSKNENIIEQLKTILEFGDFQYTIAEDVETVSIPIPDKIFGLMRECNCAIINVSADDEMKQENESYRINENVLIEIGAAFVHYDKRVILLVDKRIELPSNLQGLYRFEYEGDELSFTVAMKLQKALTEFKKSL